MTYRGEVVGHGDRVLVKNHVGKSKHHPVEKERKERRKRKKRKEKRRAEITCDGCGVTGLGGNHRGHGAFVCEMGVHVSAERHAHVMPSRGIGARPRRAACK